MYLLVSYPVGSGSGIGAYIGVFPLTLQRYSGIRLAITCHAGPALLYLSDKNYLTQLQNKRAAPWEGQNGSRRSRTSLPSLTPGCHLFLPDWNDYASFPVSRDDPCVPIRTEPLLMKTVEAQKAGGSSDLSIPTFPLVHCPIFPVRWVVSAC